jgi:hypothetical protein
MAVPSTLSALDTLRAACNAASALPWEPVELCGVDVVSSVSLEAPLLALRVSAPSCIGVEDISLTHLSRFVHRGKCSSVLSLHLLEAHPVSQFADDAASVLVRLASHLCARITAAAAPLSFTAVAAIGAGRIDITVEAPENMPDGACIEIAGVSLCGQALAVFTESGAPLPAWIPVTRGMQAPLVIPGAADGSSQTHAISLDGTLYAPIANSNILPRFAASGERLLPDVPVDRYGLGINTGVAVLCELTRTLYLSESRASDTKLVAVDAETMERRWVAPLRSPAWSLSPCYGAAVLPSRGVLFLSSYTDDRVFAVRASDGEKLASVHVRDPKFVAADDATGTVYVSTSHSVVRFQWTPSQCGADHEGIGAGHGVVAGELVPDADLSADLIGKADSWRPLAIVPPAPGHRRSHLLVGVKDKPTLHILSLPEHELVHTHMLEGFAINGLVADPHGCALAVSDGVSKSIHVLSWPLPGMPPLE